MHKKYLLYSLVLSLTLIGCKNEPKDIDDLVLKKELEKYAVDYMSELKSVLLDNMKAGGPIQAVNVCSDTAAEMTASFSEQTGVEIKRFSFNNRNSRNYPVGHENEILNEFEKLNSVGELKEDSYILRNVNIEGKQSVIFAKPIFIAAPCLNCHGEENQISNDVKAVISEKYPDDKAVGYKIGDLRGAISVSKALITNR